MGCSMLSPATSLSGLPTWDPVIHHPGCQWPPGWHESHVWRRQVESPTTKPTASCLGCVQNMALNIVYFGWWFHTFFCSPLLGEMIQFEEHIFQMGGSTTNKTFFNCKSEWPRIIWIGHHYHAQQNRPKRWQQTALPKSSGKNGEHGATNPMRTWFSEPFPLRPNEVLNCLTWTVSINCISLYITCER